MARREGMGFVYGDSELRDDGEAFGGRFQGFEDAGAGFGGRDRDLGLESRPAADERSLRIRSSGGMGGDGRYGFLPPGQSRMTHSRQDGGPIPDFVLDAPLPSVVSARARASGRVFRGQSPVNGAASFAFLISGDSRRARFAIWLSFWMRLSAIGSAGTGIILVRAFMAFAGAGMVFPQSDSDYIIRRVYLQYCLSCPLVPAPGTGRRSIDTRYPVYSQR